ncbi:MAG: hypothetical protein JNN12_14605 [Bacteroidetes Order II. Incertae sedis bacterium]|nr:hypothetical protein [Bacteroidetes Order II. bacterium]
MTTEHKTNRSLFQRDFLPITIPLIILWLLIFGGGLVYDYLHRSGPWNPQNIFEIITPPLFGTLIPAFIIASRWLELEQEDMMLFSFGIVFSLLLMGVLWAGGGGVWARLALQWMLMVLILYVSLEALWRKLRKKWKEVQ